MTRDGEGVARRDNRVEEMARLGVGVGWGWGGVQQTFRFLARQPWGPLGVPGGWGVGWLLAAGGGGRGGDTQERKEGAWGREPRMLTCVKLWAQLSLLSAASLLWPNMPHPCHCWPLLGPWLILLCSQGLAHRKCSVSVC